MSRTSWIRPALVVGAMGAVAATSACDGTNRFAGPGPTPGPGPDGRPPTVEILDPRSSLPVGDSLLVSARADDGDGIATITFVGRTLRGDPSLGTDESVVRFAERTVTFAAPPDDTTVSRFLVPTEDAVRETTWIVVTATDTEGNVSADSVPLVLGGPAVDFQNLAAPQAGTDLPLQVRATDPLGVSSIVIDVSGAVDTTLVREFSPVLEQAALDTLLSIPAGTSGQLQVSAEAVNTRGQRGSTNVVSLTVAQQGAADDVAPSLRLDVAAAGRLELQNELRVQLLGQDNSGGSGIRTAGATVLAISPTRGDTLLRDTTLTFDRPRSGTVTQTFSFRPFNVDSLNLPDTLTFEVTGYFIDESGNCAATTSESQATSLPCAQLTLDGRTAIVPEGLPGLRLEREIVAGKTVELPAGGAIMDAAVDTLRGNLFLSNIRRNRVEVFDLQDEVFGGPIGVGSEPWGLALVNDFVAPDPDSLVVANSNGTNLEMIDLDTEQARPDERFFFPDVTIFNLFIEDGSAGVTFNVETIPDLGNLAFSDRPQYIAVDTFGARIFSTVAVDETDEVGTVRKSFFEEGWEQPETKIFVEHAVFAETENAYAIAHIDDVRIDVSSDSLSAVVALVDHVPGFPDSTIVGTADIFQGELLTQAYVELRNKGSDVFLVAGGIWDVNSVGFRDTTYVAGSGDGTHVAIGEGAAQPFGRVLLYEAAPGAETRLTGSVSVADLLTNRPEPVRGIGMNYDGTIGVVRGESEVAFFDSGLRKQGGTSEIEPGGSGAALHPLHANQKTLFNLGGRHLPNVHLAFIGSGDGTIDIVDTFRFLRIGSVTIRDVPTGPLRAVLPLPGDNPPERNCPKVPIQDRRGFTIGEAVQLYLNDDFNQPAPSSVVDDSCVVVKLFGVTEAGGVVVVDVRKADILRLHPARR